MIERRTFVLGLMGLATLPHLPGCSRGLGRFFDPQRVLNELRSDPAIAQIRRGELVFRYRDNFSDRGKGAMQIIQHGLFALDLVAGSPDDFNFGVYGPRTVEAVRRLQAGGNVDAIQGDRGRKFEAATLLVMENALGQKVNGPEQ